MGTFEELYELSEVLSDNEMWNSALKNTLDSFGVGTLDDLVNLVLEEEDETIIYDLINEGQYIISLSQDDVFGWYNDDEIFDDY